MLASMTVARHPTNLRRLAMHDRLGFTPPAGARDERSDDARGELEPSAMRAVLLRVGAVMLAVLFVAGVAGLLAYLG
jgi:hypothetical protein